MDINLPVHQASIIRPKLIEGAGTSATFEQFNSPPTFFVRFYTPMWRIFTSYFSAPTLVILHKILGTLPISVDKLDKLDKCPQFVQHFVQSCPALEPQGLRALCEKAHWTNGKFCPAICPMVLSLGVTLFLQV